MIKAFARRREGRAAASGRLVVLAAGLALTGCSMSIPGFLDRSPTGAVRTQSYPFAQEDWAKAQPALLAAIRAEAGDDPAPWSNDASGRSGVVIGIGARFSKSGENCRAFVARIADNGDAREVEGSACEKGGEVTLSDAGPLPKV